uniref:Uncharacterized protein n=1 Tax=Ananas comosus var. bracteatus TaxID=296719 RepID=A0A6V7Q604_ANACO|nr:unnamed protein product [Ananas comosus var. bracteatus]
MVAVVVARWRWRWRWLQRRRWRARARARSAWAASNGVGNNLGEAADGTGLAASGGIGSDFGDNGVPDPPRRRGVGASVGSRSAAAEQGGVHGSGTGFLTLLAAEGLALLWVLDRLRRSKAGSTAAEPRGPRRRNRTRVVIWRASTDDVHPVNNQVRVLLWAFATIAPLPSERLSLDPFSPSPLLPSELELFPSPSPLLHPFSLFLRVFSKIQSSQPRMLREDPPPSASPSASSSSTSAAASSAAALRRPPSAATCQ